eukprot:CAMPEP_0197916362 /NCGR_PEP_ID=MMETSP1439-20131203/81844_1 /TAXON_ID=66791 /ORGANISM="Gonyaulax spinifera, Strain CCMP409" /LENGTH=36 /DNA_ID= /DNA_START= /DNA_END= /DNA_ORIENTATION=
MAMPVALEAVALPAGALWRRSPPGAEPRRRPAARAA